MRYKIYRYLSLQLIKCKILKCLINSNSGNLDYLQVPVKSELSLSVIHIEIMWNLSQLEQHHDQNSRQQMLNIEWVDNLLILLDEHGLEEFQQNKCRTFYKLCIV